jgi:hypothetical protein
MGVEYFFCNTIDWVLIEIFKILIKNENILIPISNDAIEVANPIQINVKLNNKNEINSGFLLSNLATNQPEIGTPTNELMGIANNNEPNSASFKSKKVLMVGIREAQLAKVNPDKKKKVLNAIRWVNFSSIK